MCDICGSAEVKIRRITRTYGKGDDLLVIENIPVISCSDCGESYLTADTIHIIERIKQNRRSIAVERPVKVATFA